LWVMTSLGSVHVVSFFDVAARLRSGDGSIAVCSKKAGWAIVTVPKIFSMSCTSPYTTYTCGNFISVFTLLKVIHSQQSQTVTIHSELERKTTKYRQLPMS